MRLLSALAFVVVCVSQVMAQNGACSEASIKTALSKHDDPSVMADDTYFFSGALDRPVVGKAALSNASKPLAERRKSENYRPDQPERIVVSPSGDMAYEYGTERIAFDEKATGKHVDFTAAYLRVWKAEGGKCLVAAQMFEREENKP
jgi:ketosteroid isomerase-like protein